VIISVITAAFCVHMNFISCVGYTQSIPNCNQLHVAIGEMYSYVHFYTKCTKM
jgi:hypothetical protein